jgi:predicted alpha/beta hydrolase family esterase
MMDGGIMRRLFFHGLEGSVEGTKASQLKENGFEAVAWQKKTFKASVDHVVDMLRNESDEMILVGSSLGALLVNQVVKEIHGCSLVLINPPTAGVSESALKRFADLREFPWSNRSEDTTVIVSKHDSIVDPGDTINLFRGAAYIIEVDDDHRASRPETLEILKKAIQRAEFTYAL